jgi:uncharacterized protein
MADRRGALARGLGALQSCVLSYSGGADSSLVLAVGVSVLGDELLAVIVDSPSLPAGELDAARDLAASVGARLEVLEGRELEDEDYAANPPDRCFICKRRMLAALEEVRVREGFACIADGTNADDLAADRAGRRAAIDAGVVSPLADAGLTKSDVRELSRELGLPTTDKPSLACLATRIPFGERVTAEKLAAVDRAEQGIRALGFPVVRVRHHGEAARVEVPPADAGRAALGEQAIAAACESAGFRRVVIDPDGYHSEGEKSGVDR